MTALVGEKKALLIAYVFVLSSILLVGCGSGRETPTVTKGETTDTSGEKNSKEQERTQNGQGEEVFPPAPTPTPPEPPPTPSSPPVAQEVNCGIGAFNVLNCTGPTGEQFSCSGDSHAVGSPYSCTDPEGNQFDCNIVEARMGGFTLSCVRLLQ